MTDPSPALPLQEREPNPLLLLLLGEGWGEVSYLIQLADLSGLN